MPARDLFISHSSGDVAVARALRTILEEAGYTCWMAPDDIVGTETWTEQILDAIADSKAMLILVSAASNKSQHVSREVNLALGKGRPVLPIRIEDVAPGGSLEYLLSLVQRVDAFPPPVGVHRDRILRQVDTIVERPSASPTGAIATSIATSTASSPPGPAPERRPETRQGSGPNKAMFAVFGIAAIAVVAVFASGLLKPGGATPTSGPATGSSASPSTSTSGGLTDPPASVPPTAAPLSEPERTLLAILPSVSGKEACTTWPTPPGGDDVLSPSGYAGSTARLRCPGPNAGGPPTEFALYPTKAGLDADYDSIMTALGVVAGGACLTAIPANAPWNFPTYPESGRLACFEREGQVQYVWTHNGLRVLGQWLAPDNATGLAFWRTWTQTFNAAELDLVATLPSSADELGACVRSADRYYETAEAIIACPRPTGENSVFYASFPATVTFPDDSLTQMFDSILTAGGFPEDTTTGCYQEPPEFGRYTWGYSTDGVIGPTEGYIGCYERTDTTPTTIQFVWTHNRLGVMGLWSPPDLATGIEFFDDWIGEIR